MSEAEVQSDVGVDRYSYYRQQEINQGIVFVDASGTLQKLYPCVEKQKSTGGTNLEFEAFRIKVKERLESYAGKRTERIT